MDDDIAIAKEGFFNIQRQRFPVRLIGQVSVKLSVLAYLPKALKPRLQAAVQGRHLIHFGECWAEITSALREKHIDVLIIDPSIESASSTPVVARLMEEFPSVATMLYGAVSPTLVKAVRDLSRRGLYEVILAEYEDQPGRMRSLIESVPSNCLLPLVFFYLREELGRIPTPAAKRIRDVFETPFIVHSADDLAMYVGISRTLLYEAFAGVGLGSPKRLIIGARLLRAYAYLRDSGHPFRVIVKKCGFVEYRALRINLENAFGMPVSQLKECADHDMLVRRLVGWMKKGTDLREVRSPSRAKSL